MSINLYFPSYPLQQVIEYYFHHTVSFNSASFKNLYSTPVLECLVLNFSSNPQATMEFGGKTYELKGNMHLFGQPVLPGGMTGSLDEYIVIKFRPSGIWRLTGISMHHIANQIIDAADVFGSDLHQVYEQVQNTSGPENKISLIDAFFLKLLKRKTRTKEHPGVSQALRLLTQHAGNITVKTLQEETCTTRKSLERAFTTQLGILPKLYSRIVRYNFAKSLIETSSAIDWQRITHQHGYYDQSHFINEFKTFSGETPLDYYQDRFTTSNELSVLLSPAISLNV